jgi:cysteine desulfurase
LIYLDYNATTPLCAPAREAMLPYLERHYGNASSIHAAGREARAAIDDARDALAALTGAKPHELIFTGSGTEANNLAVLGLARANATRGRHLITASTEHHAVLHPFQQLQRNEQFEVTFLPVDSGGRIDPDELGREIRPQTTLVSIMTANNETGVVQPLRESRKCVARAASCCTAT